MRDDLEAKISQVFVDSMELMDKVKRSIRVTFLPPFYGLLNVLHSDYNDVVGQVTRLETNRKRLSELLEEQGIKYEYKPYNIGLKRYINTPIYQYDPQGLPVLLALKIGAAWQAYGCIKYNEKELSKMRALYGKDLNLDIPVSAP